MTVVTSCENSTEIEDPFLSNTYYIGNLIVRDGILVGSNGEVPGCYKLSDSYPYAQVSDIINDMDYAVITRAIALPQQHLTGVADSYFGELYMIQRGTLTCRVCVS